MNNTKENKLYELWLDKVKDSALKSDLLKIQGNDKEIYERFYKNLNFGTAGLRGILGAGTNRMNLYTVAKATQGYANYINKHFENPSVAIAYDSRNMSEEFARMTAEVFCGNNIKVYIFSELMPTPILSYAVRTLKTTAGIVITASHNPAEYNGYKAYNNEGCQIDEETAADVLKEINKLDIFSDIFRCEMEKGLNEGKIQYIDNDICESFVEKTYASLLSKDITQNSDLSVVYTPLNGTGYKPVMSIFNKMGLKNVHVVESQKMPDGNFPTCPYPNPEIKDALALGLKLCRETGADILVASDPDADRAGVAVKQNDDYVILTGNQIGELLTYYICKMRTEKNLMPITPVIVKSVVSSKLCDKIAVESGVRVKSVLTGFKNIGGYMKKLEEQGKLNSFIMGFEESCGYLTTDLARDKDSVCAMANITEMAAYFKSQGKTLVDVLNDLYAKYGCYYTKSKSFEFKGSEGEKMMQKIMVGVHQAPPSVFGEFRLIKSRDFENEEELKANMVELELNDDITVMIRPSGTEPKIKFYYFIVAENTEKCLVKYEKAVKATEEYLTKFDY